MFGLHPFNLKHEPSLTNMSSASSLPHGSAHQNQETPSMEFDKLLFQTQFTPDNTTKSSNHNPVSIAETINPNARYCNLNSVSNMNVPVSSSHFQNNPLETLDSGMASIFSVWSFWIMINWSTKSSREFAEIRWAGLVKSWLKTWLPIRTSHEWSDATRFRLILRDKLKFSLSKTLFESIHAFSTSVYILYFICIPEFH